MKNSVRKNSRYDIEGLNMMKNFIFNGKKN